MLRWLGNLIPKECSAGDHCNVLFELKTAVEVGDSF